MERKFQLQYNFKIIPYPNLVVVKFGEEYSSADYLFFSSLMSDQRDQLPEWKILFGPNQLILDFSENKFADQSSFELCALIEEHQNVKGKKLIICGLKAGEKFYFEWQGKNYLEDALQFDTLEEGFIYCGAK